MLSIHCFCLVTTGKHKQGKTTSRKSKSPNLGHAYTAGERPSSVSSVHSEGDYHRQAQAQWSWDDRPSSTGELSLGPCTVSGNFIAQTVAHRTLLTIEHAFNERPKVLLIISYALCEFCCNQCLLYIK